MDDADDDADSMDWTPTDPSAASKMSEARRRSAKSANADDGTWLRPQRFFPPEQPTGLEGLFARTLLVDDAENEPRQNDGSRPPPRLRLRYRWLLLVGIALIPMFAIGYRLWWIRNVKFTHTSDQTPILAQTPTLIDETTIEYDGDII